MLGKMEKKVTIPKTMRAAVAEKAGGPDVLKTTEVPVPELGDDEILIRVDSAGVGVWDPWLREGAAGKFPSVLGSDGAGTVVAIGKNVKRFRVGDHAYGYAYNNPKGGFYAEYVAIPEDAAAPTPTTIRSEEAGAFAVSGITALIGLEKLKIRQGCKLMIVGASGGVGHVAVQLAKRMGAKVLAVSSGPDGVELTERLGADVSVDGHKTGLVEAIDEFAPEGLDAALIFANSDEIRPALAKVRKGGTIAHTNGVEPEPEAPSGVRVIGYDGLPSRELYDRLNSIVSKGGFHVELNKTYTLDRAPDAHRDVEKHHIGKLVFKIS